MNIILFIVWSVCVLLVGLLWPKRAERRANPKPHRLADDSHYWLDIDGEAHAFTDDQLLAARDRAKRLAK